MAHFDVPAKRSLSAQQGESFSSLVELMQLLLAPGGCPWDREQSIESLRPYVLEEACEVMDAIDSGDRGQLEEELGDLALQIVFLAELGRAEGAFGPDDVVRSICEKLVRRHPHVFGDTRVDDADEVLRNWDAIKEQEKARRLLSGVPRSFPALARAHEVSRKVARVGFDWPDPRGSRDKVAEELGELDAAVAEGDGDRVEEELGDLLFALVNLARHHGLDAETALRRTTDKFVRRFEHVEDRVRERHGGWPKDERGKPTTGIGLQPLDDYWEEAKRHERSE